MVILDLGLPDMDGMDVLTQLRAWSLMPVVARLRADGTSARRCARWTRARMITSLKPFGAHPSCWRVCARRSAIRARRAATRASRRKTALAARGLVIDYDKYRVYIDGRDAGLTQNELLVALLGRFAGRVLTYDYLILRAKIWGPTRHMTTRSSA